MARDISGLFSHTKQNSVHLEGYKTPADKIKVASVNFILGDNNVTYSGKTTPTDKDKCLLNEWPIPASDIHKDIYKGCIWNRAGHGKPCHDSDGDHYSCWACEKNKGWEYISPLYREGGGCDPIDPKCHPHSINEARDNSKGSTETKWTGGEQIWCYTACNTVDGWVAEYDNKGYISECVADDCSDYPMLGTEILKCKAGKAKAKTCGGKTYIYCDECVEGYQAINGVCVVNQPNETDDNDDTDDIDDDSCAGYIDQTLYPYNLANCTFTGGTVKRCPSDPTKIGCDCSQTGLPTNTNMEACYYQCNDTFTYKTYFMLAEDYKLVDGQCIKDDSAKEKCSADYKYTAGSNDFNTYCANKGGKATACAYDPSKVACDCTGLSSSKIDNCKTQKECPNTLTNTTYYKCDTCEDGYEPNSTGTECVKKEETTTCDENLYPYTLGARAFKLKCENIGGTATHCEHNYTVVGCDCTGLSSSKIDNCKTQKECLNTSTNTTYYKCNACADGYEPNSTGTECVKKEETCDVNQYPYGGEQIVSKCTDHGGKNEACKKADNVWRHGCHCEDSTFSTKKSVANCKIYDTCTDTFKNNTEYYKCSECKDGYNLKGGACYADPCNSCSGDACCHCKCGSDYSYAGSNWCSRTVPATTAPAGETWIGDKNSSGSWKCQTKNPEEDTGNEDEKQQGTASKGRESTTTCSQTFSIPKVGGTGYSAPDAGYSGKGCQKPHPYDAIEGAKPEYGTYCLRCKTGFCANHETGYCEAYSRE